MCDLTVHPQSGVPVIISHQRSPNSPPYLLGQGFPKYHNHGTLFVPSCELRGGHHASNFIHFVLSVPVPISHRRDPRDMYLFVGGECISDIDVRLYTEMDPNDETLSSRCPECGCGCRRKGPAQGTGFAMLPTAALPWTKAVRGFPYDGSGYVEVTLTLKGAPAPRPELVAMDRDIGFVTADAASTEWARDIVVNMGALTECDRFSFFLQRQKVPDLWPWLKLCRALKSSGGRLQTPPDCRSLHGLNYRHPHHRTAHRVEWQECEGDEIERQAERRETLEDVWQRQANLKRPHHLVDP